MTITRHSSAGALWTWFRPAPRCLLGTTPGPDAALALRRRGRKQAARIAAAIVAIAALAAVGVAGQSAAAESFAVLGHLHGLWIPAAVLLYRLASFWLVALAGWLVMLWLRRPRARRGTEPRPRPAMQPGRSGRPAEHQDTPVPKTNLPSAPPKNRPPAALAEFTIAWACSNVPAPSRQTAHRSKAPSS